MNSLAEYPCSLLDDSFLPGGLITAQCSANSTWDALDMSQCTFRSDVQVATVAVVEVLPSSAMQEETIEVLYIAKSFIPTIIATLCFRDMIYN